MSTRRTPPARRSTWLTDSNLLGKWFAGPTWVAARALVAAIFAEPMTPAQFAIYEQCTGRTTPPTQAVREAWIAAGRGAGKTIIAAAICVIIAASRDWRVVLGPGELAVVMLLAPDRKQARIAMRFVRAMLRETPMLAQLIESETRDSVTLTTRVTTEIHTWSNVSTRGYGCAAVVGDEVGFVPADEHSANPDVEVIRALRPALARVPGSLLLGISSPYAKRGMLWQMHQKYHGVEDAPVLTWQAPSRVMNPTIPEHVVTQALEEDESAARSEWLGQFRDDLESYVSIETLRAVTVPGRTELPPSSRVRFFGFTDAAGGNGQDSFTLAISHKAADGKRVLDKLVEIRPPFSPDAAVRELSAILRAYELTTVYGDKYAGSWPADRFRQHDVTYRESELTRSELYLELLPALTAGTVELLDHPRLLAQFANLDRRRGRSGKDSVDHPARGHDDLCNAVAGALVLLGKVWQRPTQPIRLAGY